MRADAADQDMVAVDDQVMGGDRRPHVLLACDVIHALRRGDMFHHHAQAGGRAAHRVQHAVDEHRLAVEDVDGGVRHLAMGAKRNPRLGHRLQHRAHLVEIPHARGRIRGGPGRVELDRRDDSRGMGGNDIGGIGRLGQIQGHQRTQRHIFGQNRQNPVPIGGSLRTRHHRGHKVRHDDGAAEMTGICCNRSKHVAIPQVQVPVVGASKRYGVCHGFPLYRRAAAGNTPPALEKTTAWQTVRGVYALIAKVSCRRRTGWVWEC